MKQTLGFIGLLLIGIPGPPSCLAQTIKGTVRDSTGNAVAYASINLRNRLKDAIVAYTTTDTGGAYVLHPPAGVVPGDLYIEVRCIGYKEQTRSISALPEVIDFTLAVSASQMQSVVVQNTKPVLRTHGDILSYKVTDFSEAQDRVIGDVIKRLPGISVAQDGTIYYNGRPISSVYIGGDNLLDDNYSIATTSIPKNVVEQVQVIDNHQPIKVLQNKVNSNDVALNLTMTKTAKLQMMGQESVGAGLPGNYNVDLNALLFKDEYKAINYLKGNNTGHDLQRELVSHNAAANQQRLGTDPPNTLLLLGTVNNPALASQRYLFDRSGMLNANDLINLNQDWQLRLNAWYLRDQQKQDFSQVTSIFLPGDTVRYSETQHNQINPDLLRTQFTVLLNSNKCYLNDVMLMDDKRYTNYSHLNTNGSLVDQVLRDNPVNLSNEFNWMRSVRSKDIIQAYSYFSHMVEPENRTIGPSYNDSLFNNGAPYSQLVQTVNVPTWFTNNYISYKIPGNILTKSFRAGFNDQSQMLTSNLNLLQSNNSLTKESDSSVNNLSWKKQKVYAEVAFDIPGQKLKATLTLPITYQQLNYSDHGHVLNKGLTRYYFDPQLIGKYKVGLENFVTFQYSYLNQTGSIEDIYQGYILKDYRTLNVNSQDLTLRQNQTAAVGFNYRKAMKLFFWSLILSYNHVGANNITSSVITNNFQRLVMLAFPNSTNSWTADGTISKYAFVLHTTFDGEVKWQNNRSVQLQNAALLPFNTTVRMLTLGAETKLSDPFGFSYHISGTQTYSHSPAEVSTGQVDQLLQQLAIYYNPTSNLQFKLDVEHYFTHSQGNPDLNYFFADAYAKYHIKKQKIDLQLDATNLLNVKTYNALYLRANTLAASSYTLPGRIILLKLLFNI
ncbi:MAG TPA: carboxypeptidase regulatory-like domain-containing protein [Chryseolinea sp.]|nr:carboxypeptidase regulatory-like domain-containing protein [Chryseolinea sp.]